MDPPGEEVVGKVRDLLERYPKSSYADYARLALARYHLYGGDFIPNNPRYSHRVEQAIAIDYLVSILSYTPDRPFPYRPQVLVRLHRVDAAARDGCAKVLNDDYRDALEWLHVVAPTMEWDEWRKFRLRAVKEAEK